MFDHPVQPRSKRSGTQNNYVDQRATIKTFDVIPFVPFDRTKYWVSGDTHYEHTFTIRSTRDLNVGGKYRFTIEPGCTMEIVPSVIKMCSGVLSIERAGC